MPPTDPPFGSPDEVANSPTPIPPPRNTGGDNPASDFIPTDDISVEFNPDLPSAGFGVRDDPASWSLNPRGGSV